MRGKPLGADQVAWVVEAFRAGEEPREIASRIGVCPGTVRRYGRRAGLRFRVGARPKSDLRQRLADLYRAGLSYTEIRALTGAGKPTIRLALLESGIEGRPKAPRSRIDREAIFRLTREGQGCHRIGRALGCSHQYVRAVLRRGVA